MSANGAFQFSDYRVVVGIDFGKSACGMMDRSSLDTQVRRTVELRMAS